MISKEAFFDEIEKIALSSEFLLRAADKARQLGGRAARRVKDPRRIGNIERNLAADEWLKRTNQAKKFQTAALEKAKKRAAKAPLPLP